MLSTADASKLTALVQTSHQSDEGDADINAPDPAIYKSHSGDILATLQGLFDKAEAQLAELRKTETTNVNNFQMLRQSIEDELTYGNKELVEAKEGLAADTETLADLHADCLAKATDFEDETKSRGEELKALHEAKKAIKDMTGGAETLSYGLNQVSLVQLSAQSKL